MVVTWWPVSWWDFSEWRVLWCSSNDLYYNTKEQSIISQSPMYFFFYYHLVSPKEKTSVKTTPTNAIQNGALRWESRVLAVFEEWDLFQVLFYFLNLFFNELQGHSVPEHRVFSRILGFFIQGTGADLFTLTSQRACSVCSEVVCAELGSRSSQEGTSLVSTQVQTRCSGQ